jgi:ATP-dependent RNA helicase DeaD
MESFEELGVTPELVDSLTDEGIEVPTEFQSSAIPVLLRGNPLLAQAGPGAGTLIAYGVPLLQRIEAEAPSLRAIVLAPSTEAASRLAASLARLAQITGHRVGALEADWAVPELASILFATPQDFLRRVRGSQLTLEDVEAIVIDGFGGLQPEGRAALDTIFEALPKDVQKILLSQPLSADAESFGRDHFSKAVHLPPRAAQSGSSESPLRRGEVSYRIASERKEPEVLRTVSAILEEGARHALLFFRSEDQAADFGDFLTIHGYASGAPGEVDFPIWLAVDELAARRVLDGMENAADVETVSVDVPAEPDSLDRRHGGQQAGTILLHSRELPHLREVARETGYTLVPAKEPVPTRVSGELERLRNLIEKTLKEEELAPYYLAIEPLLQSYSPVEVAAAALALLKEKASTARSPEAESRGGPSADRPSAPAPKAWVRLFVAVGDKDGVGPGDLLGAISGEAGVEGSQVGKIEIKDTYSLVEVLPGVADKIIRGLNGTTIRGRAVRVDHDRGGPRGRSGPSPNPGPGARPRRKLRGDGPRDG